MGDRIGSKPKSTLIFELIMMTLATAAIEVVPTYAQLGILVPLIVTGLLLKALVMFIAGGVIGLLAEI